MSDWTPIHHTDHGSASDAWRPRHHADMPAEKPAKPKAAAAKKPTESEPAPKAEPAGPMSVALTLPEGLQDGLAELAWSQQSLAEKLRTLTTAIDGRMGDLEAAMQTAQQPVLAAQQALTTQIKTLAEAQPQVAANIAAWSATIEKAIRAPRQVSLQRGADGLATGAVSTVAGDPH